MRLVNCTYARIRVIISIHAKAKWSRIPQRCSTPVIVIVLEAIHFFRQAFLFQLGLLSEFSLLLL